MKHAPAIACQKGQTHTPVALQARETDNRLINTEPLPARKRAGEMPSDKDPEEQAGNREEMRAPTIDQVSMYLIIICVTRPAHDVNNDAHLYTVL